MVTRFVRILTLVVFAASGGYSASILISGNAMTSSNATLVGNLAQLPGNTYTFVSPFFFATTPLASFDLVWLDGFSQYFDLSSLTPYLNAGGRVLVQNPGFGSESLSLYPNTAGLSIFYSGYIDPPFEANVHILAPGDFVNLGLTDGGLSGWGPSAYGQFTTLSAGFLALSDNGTSGEDITIRQTSGPGVLVYTQQGIGQYLSSQSFSAGAAPLQFLDNLLAAPEPGTAALTMIALCLLTLGRKLRYFTS